MVAVFVGLKLRLLRNGLRGGSTAKVVATVIGVAFGVGATVAGVTLVVFARTIDADLARTVLVIGGSLLVLGWAVLPVLVFGVDETIDPARFTLLPLPRRTLLAGMLAAGFVGIPAAATSLTAAATVVTWSRSPLAVVYAAVGAILGACLCVVASRATTTAMAGLLRSRRARDLISVVAVMIVASLGLLQAGVQQLAGRTPRSVVDQVAEILAWTPLGAAWAAPHDAVVGDAGVGALRLAIAAAALGLLVAGWAVALTRALESGNAVASGGVVRAGSHLAPAWAARLLPRDASGAVAARTLSYWWRDPRQRVGLIVVPVAVFGIVVGPRLGGAPAEFVLVAGPAVASLIGLTALNQTAYDGSALWVHLAAGLSGRDDRWGRAMGTLAWAVPVVVVTAGLSAVLAGRPALLPAVVGASVAALLAGIAVASVANVVAPYPAPPPGANPFSTPSGGNVATVLQQLVGGLVAGALVVPSALLLVLATVWSAAVGAVLLGAGPIYGVVLLRIGARVGGARLDTHGPEILATISPSRS